MNRVRVVRCAERAYGAHVDDPGPSTRKNLTHREGTCSLIEIS